MRVTFLGTGTSTGVPVIGCQCQVCTSPNPRDKRLRSSILIENSTSTILVDASPDFRQQALRHNIQQLHAVLFTHAHADHVMGMDDLRQINRPQDIPIPIFGNAHTLKQIRQMFRYVWETPEYRRFLPNLEICIQDSQFDVNDSTITPIPLLHGKLPIWGYRIKNFAYLNDCSQIPDTSIPLLQDLDVLVLDALRYRPHIAHFNLEEAIQQAQIIQAAKTYFTHMSHDILYDEVVTNLVPSIDLAYDGLVLELPE